MVVLEAGGESGCPVVAAELAKRCVSRSGLAWSSRFQRFNGVCRYYTTNANLGIVSEFMVHEVVSIRLVLLVATNCEKSTKLVEFGAHIPPDSSRQFTNLKDIPMPRIIQSISPGLPRGAALNAAINLRHATHDSQGPRTVVVQLVN